MVGLRRAGKIAGAGLALVLYVWFAAVGNAGRAKERKAANRRRRSSA